MKASRLFVAAIVALALLGMTGPTAAPDKPSRISGAEKVQVSLVLIDVVVRDRKDQPVAGLTRDDFELRVDDVAVSPTDIESFEEICPAQAVPAAPTGSVSTTSSPDTSAPPPSAGAITLEPRYIVLYLDFSQLSFGGRRQALKSARDHIAARIGPNDRVMILAFKKGLRLVQDFTPDSSLLTSRLDEMLNDNTTLDSDVLEEGQNLCDVARTPCDVRGGACFSRRAMAETFASQEGMRARRSLQALEDLMPSLARIRGRKALVLFTDVLREEPGVQYAVMARTTQRSLLSEPQQGGGINREPALLRLTKEANASGVSIYTVHASGLDDTTTLSLANCGSTSIAGGGGLGRNEAFDAERTALDSALAIQTTMATETGGRALKRSNDVGAILDTAQQDLSCYYLLGYRYQGHGDGRRHSILLKLRPGSDADARRSLSVRYRPYYTDMSPDDRRLRLVKSALEAPDLYRRLSITTEAFALAPDKSKRRVLIKTTVPLEALSMVPSGDSTLEGRVFVRGEVTASGSTRSPACSFEQELPLKVTRRADAVTRLVFETGCLLKPGSYDLVLTVFDPTTQEVGASRTTLSVPEVSLEQAAFVSEVHLWTREAGALVVSAGAESIGLKDSSSEKAWVPRSERRLDRGQEAMMSFLLCPAEGARPTPESPIRVRRTLLGEGDAAVATFRDLSITDPPDADTGCYQIFNTIPGNSLGDGIYRFTIQLRGAVLGAPVTREADIAVD